MATGHKEERLRAENKCQLLANKCKELESHLVDVTLNTSSRLSRGQSHVDKKLKLVDPGGVQPVEGRTSAAFVESSPSFERFVNNSVCNPLSLV